MKKHLHAIILTTLLTLTAFGVVSIIYLVFIDGRIVNPPITFQVPKAGIEVEKGTYRVGEMVRVKLNFCKNREITATWRWSLVDGILINFPQNEGTLPKGCHNVWVEVGKVPPMTQSSEVIHLEGTGIYEINRFNTVVVPLKSQNFSII